MTKLREAAGKVVDLIEPEPALMRCLRAQMVSHRGTVVEAVETEQSLTVQLASPLSAGQAPVTIHEENSSLVVTEESTTMTEEKVHDQVSVPSTSHDSEIRLNTSNPSSVNADSVSHETTDISSESTVKMTSAIPSGQNAPNSCNDNTQFLARNPVYA